MSVDNPMEQFGVDAITQNMINAMKKIASVKNQNEILKYNNAVTSVTAQNAWLLAVNRPLLPMPTPPMMLVVNEALIKQNEGQTFVAGGGSATDSDKQDWNVFFEVPYVPVVAPPPPPPQIHVNLAAFEGPGLFGADGDGPQVPVGTQITQDGHTYMKIVIGHSPFAPNGNVTAWQQIN